ncbi:hypothetical protein TetV_158 [Tetraselmis virus 1]|uniref:Thioredoxin domain-containing protein n=1 Tax=Tetraselmis virus 1 TaxID=2060617 RepID=A0A2P0VMZ0_9VIRU|nr:hypothetical protein QJ968_gp158 [Tetraselmis virus 1]AUF82250.1 hypothetical protein TetV_158 [Tetraselmis virus 1]
MNAFFFDSCLTTRKMMPLLFYSNNCPHSKKLVGSLKSNQGIERFLRFVCVDAQIDKIPEEIHSVPALLIPTTAGNKVVFETEMYEWLEGAFRMQQQQNNSGNSAYPQASAPVPPHAQQHPSMVKGLMSPPMVQTRNNTPMHAAQEQTHPSMHQPANEKEEYNPEAFINGMDAMLCDVQGNTDSANHLFAGACEEVRIPYVDDSGATSSSVTSTTSSSSSSSLNQKVPESVLDQMMTARNQELSSVYNQMKRPV